MLQALYERDIAPDLIIGTSVGGINGAYIASRPQTFKTATALGDIWRGLERHHIFPVGFAGGFLGFVGRRSHFLSNRALRRLVRTHAEFDDLAQAPIPLHVIATDAATGQEVAISRGNTVEAVLATSALPGIFPPVRWDGRLLVDGGVSNYAPISHALDLGAENIYVLTSGTACDLPEPPQGALPLLLHSMSILITGRLVVEIDHLQEKANFIVLPPPCPVDVPPHDFSQAASLIDRSYETTSAYLDALSGDGPAPMPQHLLRAGPHRQ